MFQHRSSFHSHFQYWPGGQTSFHDKEARHPILVQFIRFQYIFLQNDARDFKAQLNKILELGTIV